MKPIWLTSLDAVQDPVKQLMSTLKPYGLNIQGHFWKDDLKNMAWKAAVEHLVDSDIPVWVILASAADLKRPDILYGLSMAAIFCSAAKKGGHFPLVIPSSRARTDFQNPITHSSETGGYSARIRGRAWRKTGCKSPYIAKTGFS